MPTTPRSDAGVTLHTLIAKNLRADLGRYLRRVAQAGALGVALAACSTSHGGGDAGGDSMVEPPPPRPGFCETGGFDPLGLFEAEGFDYLGLLEDGFLSQEIGIPCSGASDVLACESALDALGTETLVRGVVVTVGDEARLYTEAPDFVALFGGEISTARQAAFMVWLRGHVICGGGFGVEELPSGNWEVTVETYETSGCDSLTYRTAFGVDRESAAVTTRSRTQVGSGEPRCAIGRLPAGQTPRAIPKRVAPVADFFSEVTRLEESAVAAFDIMIDELVGLGAPVVLVDAARRARADEVRHTSMMGELACAFGGEPNRSEPVTLESARTPYEIALENAVEGCVRETYGALVAAHQANAAADPAVARAMQVVADDEIRHAELSWALAGWLEPQLTGEERRAFDVAKREAVADLRALAGAPVDRSLVEYAGMPEPETNVRMVAQLAHDIWN